MQILILSDVHVARNTPWSKGWEDVDFLISSLKKKREETPFPTFDGAIFCGDLLNTPRVLPGDVVKFVELMEVLGLDKVPVGWVNGNHDPGDFCIAEVLPKAVNLNEETLFGVAGHNFSQNLEEVRDWLRACQAPVTVTHQSASMFMDLGKGLSERLADKQLRPEDFHAPLNFVGDTHVTSVFTVGDVNCVSPGIPVPMRSRKELFDSNPCLMVWDFDGSDVAGSEIRTIELPKRPYVHVTDAAQRLPEYRASDLPLLLFMSGSIRKEFDLSDYSDYPIRIIEYSDTVTDLEAVLDQPLENYSADTVDDIISAAQSILPEDSPNYSDILSVTRSLLTSEDPDIIVKDYLK